MKPRDIVLESIHHRHPPEVPYTLAFEDDTDLRLDEYYGGSSWRERIVPYIVGVSVVDTDPRTPVDEIRYQDAYGGVWRTDRRPWHLEKPALDKPSFDGFDFPTPQRFMRPGLVEQAKQVIEDNPDSFIMGNLGWGLFERSWIMRGFENFLLDVSINPDFVEESLDRMMNLYLELVDITCQLPVDGILFGDDWGEQRGVILGPKRWRQLLKPRWARIYERVHMHGKIVFHHSCGSVADIMPDIIEIGMDFLESAQPEAAGMNPYELKKKWGDQIGFWGCLGSQSVIPFGTPEQIKAEIRLLRKEMGRNGGYIMAPAKPLQLETPIENAVAILEAFTEESG
jgi:uroporphyrinogen decarboxylase